MKTTVNLGLKKPEGTDVVNIDDLNYNADVIDTELQKRALKTDIPTIPVQSVNGKTGAVTLAAADVGAATSAQGIKADTALQRSQLGQTEGPAKQDDLMSHLADNTRHENYVLDTSTTANTLTATSTTYNTYTDGSNISIKVKTTNTGASTLNINGLGAKPIKDSSGNPINAGTLVANNIYYLIYETIYGGFILANPNATTSATASTIAQRDSNGALTASKFNPNGSMYSKNNTLDDGSGNMTIANNASIVLTNNNLANAPQAGASSLTSAGGINGELFFVGQQGLSQKLALDHNGNLGVAGVMKAQGYNLLEALSGGYKVQSGSVSTTGNSANLATAVTFPVAFSSKPLIFITAENGVTTSQILGNISTQFNYSVNGSANGFNLVSNQNGTVTYDWFAIGN